MASINKVESIGKARGTDPMRHFAQNGALVKLAALFVLHLPKIVWAFSAGAVVITHLWPFLK